MLSREQREWLSALVDRKDGTAVMENSAGAGIITAFFRAGGPKIHITPTGLDDLKERGLYKPYDITEAGRAALQESDHE